MLILMQIWSLVAYQRDSTGAGCDEGGDVMRQIKRLGSQQVIHIDAWNEVADDSEMMQRWLWKVDIEECEDIKKT